MTVSNAPRVLIAGDGVVGLSVALHLGARGVDVTLVAPRFTGTASAASAGMLAPSVERAQGPAQDFGDAARDAWPRIRTLTDAYGAPPFEIRRDGILRVARDDAAAAEIDASLRPTDEWLTSAEAKTLAPMLGAIAGGALYPGDGVVDAPAALRAMRFALAPMRNVQLEHGQLAGVCRSKTGVLAVVDGGARLPADHIVLAAGAWVSSIAGLPRPLQVRPLRGALIELACAPPKVPVYDGHGHTYVLPRAGRTVVGATSDNAGFDATPSDRDGDRLITNASAMMPDLSRETRGPTRVGLRPMTPDGLAILGFEPDWPELVYACGHGRNGFLQAPLTGEVIADLILGQQPQFDLSPFSPGRLDGRNL